MLVKITTTLSDKQIAYLNDQKKDTAVVMDDLADGLEMPESIVEELIEALWVGLDTLEE